MFLGALVNTLYFKGAWANQFDDYLTEKELVALIDGNKLTDSTNAIIEKAKSNSIEEHKRIQYDDITLVIYKH